MKTNKTIILFTLITLSGCCPKVIHNTETIDKSKQLKLQLKYSEILQVPIDSVYNLTLYKNLEGWNTIKDLLHYTTITTSILFINYLCYNQYNIPLPHTYTEIAKDKCVYPFKNTDYLKEGDLIFFSTCISSENTIGMYLRNNRFVSVTQEGTLTFYNIKDSLNNFRIQSNAKLYKNE